MSYNMNGLINNDGSITKYGQTNSSTFPSSSVTYSNTSSGLSATTVQGAIDEVVGEMGSASMSATSGQSNQYTITDGNTSANFYNKAAVDALISGSGGSVSVTTDSTTGNTRIVDSDTGADLTINAGAQYGTVKAEYTSGSNSARLTNYTGNNSSQSFVVPTSLALESYQTKVTASTTDLTPGTSSLATGDIYVVYE